VSNRIAVLRAGKLVSTLPAAGADKAMLAELMVGRAVAPAVRHPRPPGGVVCALRGVRLGEGGVAELEDVDLDLRAGEVVAIAGVAGNGQEALAALLCGLRAPAAGTLTVGGAALPAEPRAWVRAGVARIPEDRHAVGVVGDLPLWENAILERYATPAFARLGVIRRAAAQRHAGTLVERYDVRGTEAAGLATPTRALSGGNMQKLILGRTLMGDPASSAPPTLIVANQPTWGLDIGAVAYVHQQLLDACAAGSAVLLVSEDLDEIFALADRIAVIHHGRLTATRPTAEWTLAAIGLAMTGAAAQVPEHAAA
jgi:ABC-type uncharacterized transport system ATPase subunit